jgi:hypothetical protein
VRVELEVVLAEGVDRHRVDAVMSRTLERLGQAVDRGDIRAEVQFRSTDWGGARVRSLDGRASALWSRPSHPSVGYEPAEVLRASWDLARARGGLEPPSPVTGTRPSTGRKPLSPVPLHAQMRR